MIWEPRSRRFGAYMGKVVDTSDADFDVVTRSDEWVLVDFWAPWCAPCVSLSPILEAIDKELNNKLTVAKQNIDEEPNIPTAEGVRGIPTMQIYKDSVLVDTIVGLTNKSDLTNKIKVHLD